MLVFIDESGDTGLRTENGSSRYFVIAMVIFKDKKDSQYTRQVVQKYKISIRKSNELKFSKESEPRRIAFLNAVEECPFSVEYLVLDKNNKESVSILRETKVNFNAHLMCEALLSSSIRSAHILIDNESGSLKYRGYIHRVCYAQKESLQFIDSIKDPLIQLADMVAGAIRAGYNGKPIYTEIINKKVKLVKKA